MHGNSTMAPDLWSSVRNKWKSLIKSGGFSGFRLEGQHIRSFIWTILIAADLSSLSRSLRSIKLS